MPTRFVAGISLVLAIYRLFKYSAAILNTRKGPRLSSEKDFGRPRSMSLEWVSTDKEGIDSLWGAVLERKEFYEELDQLCRVQWHYGAMRSLRAQTLRVHRNRATFDIGIKTEKQWHNVIAKLHQVDRSDIFQAMKDVVNAGFGPEKEFGTARPLAYLASSHVLFEEKIQGTPGKEAFLQGSPNDQREVVGRCGAWLARFHTAIPRLGKNLDPHELLLSLQKGNDAIRSLGEPLADRCEQLLRKVKNAVPARTSEYCGGHGSYMTDHVFSSGPRTVTIDLDEHDTADPARDLATFIISLKRLGLKHRNSLHAFDDAVEAFLRAYSAIGPSRAVEHLAFYKAAHFLHKAQQDLYKWTPPLRNRAENMVDEGFLAL